MRQALLAVAIIALAGACDPSQDAEIPAGPVTLTAEAAGHYCQMTVLDHAGPKAQVHLAGNPNPLWFTQVRDAIAYRRQREQSAEVVAVYVSDMGRAPSWEAPGADNWIDISSAHLVVGSHRRGGMGAPELVPFASAEDARSFAGRHGGQILRIDQIADDMVLGPVEVDPENMMPGQAHHGGEG